MIHLRHLPDSEHQIDSASALFSLPGVPLQQTSAASVGSESADRRSVAWAKRGPAVARGVLALATTWLTLTLLACQGPITSEATASLGGPAISGTVRGGKQPLVGASVQLYAAGTTGFGSDATPLLSAAVITNDAGAFSISAGYTCPAPDSQVYLLSTGGNPGLTTLPDNQAMNMITALGSCSAPSNTSSVVINELTTIASVWPLARFMKSATRVGTDSANLALLADAFTVVNQFTDVRAGSAPGPLLPATATIPVSKLDSLSNILSICIHSVASSTGTQKPCKALLSTTSMGGSTAPTTVIDAALQIAMHPTTEVAQIFDFSPSIAPFQPTLNEPPVDWTLPIVASVSTPVIVPGSGSFVGSQTVTVSDATPSAAIHYTVDGSTPSATSPIYTAPLTLQGSATVRVMATLGTSSSNLNSASFVLLSGVPQKLVFATQAGHHHDRVRPEHDRRQGRGRVGERCTQFIHSSDVGPGRQRQRRYAHRSSDGQRPQWRCELHRVGSQRPWRRLSTAGVGDWVDR